MIPNRRFTVSQLIEKIKYHNQLYRSGNEEITDNEYDMLVDRLKELDPDNEWFNKIEPVVISEQRKESLPVPMRSLDKEKTMAGVQAWLKKYGMHDGVYVVIMPKYDGISLLVEEKSGRCWTRGGNDNEGQQSNLHLEKMMCSRHPEEFTYTFGEAIISKKNWNEHFKGKINPRSGNPYKSARNTVSGFFRNDVPPEELKYVDFVRYGGTPDHYNFIGEGFSDFYELLNLINSTYNQDTLHLVIKVGYISVDILQRTYDLWKQYYEIDGLVIYINDADFQKSIGRHHSTGNPLYAIAYKGGFEDIVETKITGIDWNVSKAGYLKPVIQIDPVELASATITNVSGYNARFISDNQIAKDAVIKVRRSGEVIPQMLDVVMRAPINEYEDLWDSLAECPACGAPTLWNASHVELVCTNPSCTGITLAKIKHFFSIVGCDNLGEETFNLLFRSGFNTLRLILDASYDDLVKIDGIGNSMANTIIENNRRIRNGIDLPVLMHASDCFVGIGQEKSKAILDKLEANQLDRLFNSEHLPIIMNLNDLTKTMTDFHGGIVNFRNLVSNAGLKINPYKTVETVIVGDKCNGMNVCFSGIRDKDLEGFITSNGGTIASGVSNKTTHLVVKDVGASSSKITKAQSLGCNVMEINDFRQSL